MSKVYIFDVDGTLTPSRRPMTRSFDDFFFKWANRNTFYLVSGSDLDIAGVDLLFDNGGYKICEVNSNPGFEGMETFTKKNIAEEIVQFIKMKIGAFDE